MQSTYLPVTEAAMSRPLISALRQSFQTHPADHSQPPEQNRQSREPELAGASITNDERKPRALIVDDIVDVTDMLSVFFTLAGYEAVTENSAAAAIATAQSTQFDVVISDIGMPEMNGYQLAQALRSLPGYGDIPLIAVTGFSMYDDRERSLRAGFNAHLTKPLDPNILIDLIEQMRS
jgi:CheY-like chemotaxis protein